MIEKRSRRECRFKIAHECADERHPYLHTHCLVWFNKKVDTKLPSKFDFEDIHPHWQKINDYEHWKNLIKYLDKENCIVNTLIGDEYPENTGFGKNLIERIQKHNRWHDVICDKELSYEVQKVMHWAKEIFLAKPNPNLSEDIVLREWQKKVIGMLEEQNDRAILWIYDEEGGYGKSVLTNYLIDIKGAFMCNGGRLADIAHAYNGESIVVFDLPRSFDETKYIYRAMEGFKDGRLFSPKYQSCMKRFKPPVVVTFANFEPSMIEGLTRNRWDVKDICELIDRVPIKTQNNLGGFYNIKANPRRFTDESDFSDDGASPEVARDHPPVLSTIKAPLLCL